MIYSDVRRHSFEEKIWRPEFGLNEPKSGLK